MWVPAGQCSETGEEGGLGSLQTVHKETLPPSHSYANESHFVWGLKNSQGSEQRRFKPTIEPQFSQEKPTMLSLCLSCADKEISMDVWVSGCIRHWQSVMYRDHNSLTHTHISWKWYWSAVLKSRPPFFWHFLCGFLAKFWRIHLNVVKLSCVCCTLIATWINNQINQTVY